MQKVVFNVIRDRVTPTSQVFRLQNEGMVFARVYISPGVEAQADNIEWYATFFTEEQKEQILIGLREKLGQTWDPL